MRDTQSSSQRWAHVAAFRAELIAQAQRHGLTREEAEDVASEAILRAGAKPDLDLDRAGAWLRRVTRNLAVDVHRSRVSPALASRIVKGYPQHLAEPQSAVDDQLEACWLAGLVVELPARQQLVLRKRAEGRSIEQIAHDLDVPYKTVESLTSRARTTMRRAFSGALAIMVAGWAGIRRLPRIAAPSAVIATAASISIAVHMGPHRTSRHGSWPAPEAPGVATRLIHHHSPSRGTDRVTRVAVPQLPARSDNWSRKLVPLGQTGPLRHGEIVTTRRDENRTFLESVGDCLRDGVEVTPRNIGCAE